MPSEIGKWNILEIDNQFVTLSVKCYLCKHWTILRIPTETLISELKRPEEKLEREVSNLVGRIKESKAEE